MADTLTFRVLGLLLRYPDSELIAALGELRHALDSECILSAEARMGLEPLLRQLEGQDLLSSQEQYVNLFDRRRTLSLYLYEHVHGDSRDRGQAMVDLRAAYAGSGLSVDSRELPDYLPLYCEFLSLIPLEAARASLADTAPILRGIAGRLEQRRSAYAGAFGALVGVESNSSGVALSGGEGEDLDDDFAELDRQWEEQAVNFGVGAAHDSCSPPRRDGLVQLRARGAT